MKLSEFAITLRIISITQLRRCPDTRHSTCHTFNTLFKCDLQHFIIFVTPNNRGNICEILQGYMHRNFVPRHLITNENR